MKLKDLPIYELSEAKNFAASNAVRHLEDCEVVSYYMGLFEGVVIVQSSRSLQAVGYGRLFTEPLTKWWIWPVKRKQALIWIRECVEKKIGRVFVKPEVECEILVEQI